MLDITLPGTGGMVPLPGRWLSCCWIEYQGSAILIDCGEGTQIALRESGRKLSRLNILLITHYHADHVAGLPGLLLSLANSGKTTPLFIAGPKGLLRVVSALTLIAQVRAFEIRLLEIDDSAPFDFPIDERVISSLPLKHGIPCLGYRITVKRKPVFNPEKAKALNIPVGKFKVLHAGQRVKLDDGRIIEPDMVLDGERKPITVCYCTDTVLFDEMEPFISTADLLICEGMYGDESMRLKMNEKGHMLFQDAARLAKQAGVKRLWITHHSPALREPCGYLESVRAIFEDTEIAYDSIACTL